MFPPSAYASEMIIFEIAVGVEVEADQYCDDLCIGHHAFFCGVSGHLELSRSLFRHCRGKYIGRSQITQNRG